MFDGNNDVSAGAGSISIHGAREHNLKNLTLQLPRSQFVVITGVAVRARAPWHSISFLPKVSAGFWIR